MMKRHDCIASEKGIALLMVLWVLMILMVIVMSFSFMSRTETYATLSFKSGMEKKFIGEAGIERAIAEISYANFYKNQTAELQGLEVWKADGTPYKGQMGGGYYTVGITDESGKVDINNTSELVLKNLLINSGVQPNDADGIVDSIMDWIDDDDLVRLHGAESDYYMSLPNPYKAKNAPIDTLEELLLVKGVTPEILYGGGDNKGIIQFLTVYSRTNTINVNAAPREVLMAIPNMTPGFADAIIAFRQNKEMTDQDLEGIVGGNYNIMSEYISTEGTGTFTIDSAGYKQNEKGGYAIRATVVVYEDGKHKFLYYKSPVDIRQ